jgi:hypothetical protein
MSSLTFGNITATAILVATGTYFVAQAYHLNHHVVFLGWVERKWGPGSGTIAYKIAGLALILLATLIITGVVNVFEDPLQRLDRAQGGGNFDSTQTAPRQNSTPVNLSF